MAKPVKDTPILEGKDSKKFESEIKEHKKKKVSAVSYKRAQTTYREIRV